MKEIYSEETFRSRKFSSGGIQLRLHKMQNVGMSDKELTPEEMMKNRHTLRFIKVWIKHRNLTQRKMAELLDMSEPSVSKWLNGRVNMTLSQFVKVAEILEANPEDLLFDPKKSDMSPRYKAAATLASNLDDQAFEAWINAGKAMQPK